MDSPCHTPFTSTLTLTLTFTFAFAVTFTFTFAFTFRFSLSLFTWPSCALRGRTEYSPECRECRELAESLPRVAERARVDRVIMRSVQNRYFRRYPFQPIRLGELCSLVPGRSRTNGTSQLDERGYRHQRNCVNVEGWRLEAGGWRFEVRGSRCESVMNASKDNAGGTETKTDSGALGCGCWRCVLGMQR